MKQKTVFDVTFVGIWEEGRVSSKASLDVETGRVFDIESSEDGVEFQSLKGEYIEVNTTDEEVNDRQFEVELLDDDYYLVDRSDRLLLKSVLLGETAKVDVTLNTFDDEGNVVDTTSMDLSKEAVSDIVDHAAQLVLVLRAGGDAQGVLASLEEALTSRSVIAEDAAEITLSSSSKENADVAKKLAKAIQSSGLTLNGLPVTHGRALEVVSNVAGLPNWDTLSAVLKKTEEKPEPLTAEQIIDRHYIKSSSCCPYCGSDDIEGSFFDIEGNTAYQGASCHICESTWSDVYRLQGVDLSVGSPTEHQIAIRMKSDAFGVKTFGYDSLEERVEGLQRLMANKALKDGVVRTYTFLLLDGDDVVEDSESVVAEWSGKKWIVDEYGLSK